MKRYTLGNLPQRKQAAPRHGVRYAWPGHPAPGRYVVAVQRAQRQGNILTVTLASTVEGNHGVR